MPKFFKSAVKKLFRPYDYERQYEHQIQALELEKAEHMEFLDIRLAAYHQLADEIETAAKKGGKTHEECIEYKNKIAFGYELLKQELLEIDRIIKELEQVKNEYLLIRCDENDKRTFSKH